MLAGIAAVAIAPQLASAQSYPGATPRPRTTDRATMHAQATAREIDERIGRAFAAIGKGAYDDAIADLERALALHPREPQASTASYDLGVADAESGKLAQAASAFEEAIARDPGFLAARANLVTVHLRRNDLPAARAAADALLAIAPDSARALYGRGIVALAAGDARVALDDFRALLARDPKYAVAHYDLAIAESRLGAFADAERECRAALALAPAYARASLALGGILLREGKRDDARSAFDSAARDAGDVALRNLAISLRDAIVR